MTIIIKKHYFLFIYFFKPEERIRDIYQTAFCRARDPRSDVLRHEDVPSIKIYKGFGSRAGRARASSRNCSINVIARVTARGQSAGDTIYIFRSSKTARRMPHADRVFFFAGETRVSGHIIMYGIRGIYV